MPLPVLVNGTAGETEKLRLEVSQDKQLFSVQVDFQVASVQIDPETHLISRNNRAVLGLDQDSLENIISIYPNPVADELHISVSGVIEIRKVTIYNVLGKKILEQTDPQNSIAMQELEFGVHLVVIDTDQGSLHKTILKK